jgi:hypothetical protein
VQPRTLLNSTARATSEAPMLESAVAHDHFEDNPGRPDPPGFEITFVHTNVAARQLRELQKLFIGVFTFRFSISDFDFTSRLEIRVSRTHFETPMNQFPNPRLFEFP